MDSCEAMGKIKQNLMMMEEGSKRNRSDVTNCVKMVHFPSDLLRSTSIYQIYFAYQKLCTMPGQIAINSMSSNPTLRAFRFKWMRQTLNEQLHIYLYHTLEYYLV